MCRASRKKFPAGPSEGLKRWSLGPLNDNPLEYFTKLAREYGDIAGLRVLNFRSIFINHPDLIEEVLVTNARKYSKGRVLRANRHVFGEGLLTSEGDFWLRQRRLAQPAFHRARIASYAATMVEYTERMHEWLEGGEERDAHQEMMRLTRRLWKTLFDADVERDAQRWEIAGTAAGNRRQFPPYHLCAIGCLHESAGETGSGADRKIIYRIIGERPPRRRRPTIDASFGTGRGGSRMTDRQLRDEPITSSWRATRPRQAPFLTWWLLARNCSGNKLQAELDAVLGDRSCLDMICQTRLPGHVITESLRLYPAAGNSGWPSRPRNCGYTVTKEWGGHGAMGGASRPRWYDAPEFRPERWENDLWKRLPRFSYFPFGGGPRRCIGNAFALMEAARFSDDAEVSIAAGGESSRGAAGVDHAEATVRCACHARVAEGK
jgi:cytochrome P450